ncbi:hypothetical protein CCP2SC5_350028 [Azospirillaceae bacterium]
MGLGISSQTISRLIFQECFCNLNGASRIKTKDDFVFVQTLSTRSKHNRPIKMMGKGNPAFLECEEAMLE